MCSVWTFHIFENSCVCVTGRLEIAEISTPTNYTAQVHQPDRLAKTEDNNTQSNVIILPNGSPEGTNGPQEDT